MLWSASAPATSDMATSSTPESTPVKAASERPMLRIRPSVWNAEVASTVDSARPQS